MLLLLLKVVRLEKNAGAYNDPRKIEITARADNALIYLFKPFF